ncbi:hypothetical protein, conserved [Eimeria maxima]|uniref:Uncharacterized protein n=1 Tax=Eimeria maxima TaxID=5804 RepID=U6M945_EIMMA|nr:hypothetical protein, conserved [Eimeria maxima]CDJ60742.1 hypothetical protein, conserved [Eimeria maxima]
MLRVGFVPNTSSSTTAVAPEGTNLRSGDAEDKRQAKSAAAVEKATAQSAAAHAAAASARGSAAAAQAALAAGVVDEQGSAASVEIGGATGIPEPVASSLSAVIGGEAAAAAELAAEAATSAASEAANAAAAVAEAAASNDDYQNSSQLEEIIVSQGLRVALALEAAAAAAAAAADAARQEAAAATRQAAEKSSSAIASAAQRCHEAAASASASAVAAFSAAVSSAADSITSTAAAARAAIGEVTNAAAQKLMEGARAFEDTIATKTAALESSLLWREYLKSHDREFSGSPSSSSSSSVGYRHGSSSQLSSSSDRSQIRGRSSLLHYFSSDYEREGSQGGAPESPLNSADTAESEATAEEKLTGDAAIAAFISGCEESLLPRESHLDVSTSSDEEKGASATAAAVSLTGNVPRKNSVDAIVAAAAAEAAAYEAMAKRQLHQQYEISGFSNPLGCLAESPAVQGPAAAAEGAPAIRSRAAPKETKPNSIIALITPTTDCLATPPPEVAVAPEAAALQSTVPCEDTEGRQPQLKILQTQARHTATLPYNLEELQELEEMQGHEGLQEQEHLPVHQNQRLHRLRGEGLRGRPKVYQNGVTICGSSGRRVSSRGGGVSSSNSRQSIPASHRHSTVCSISSRLPFRLERRAGGRTGRGRKGQSRSLLECRLEEFIEKCNARQSEDTLCSCSSCSSGQQVSGLLPVSLRQLQEPMGGASAVSALDSAPAVQDQHNVSGSTLVAGMASRALLDCPHFSMPTISFQQQDTCHRREYDRDEDEVKRLVLLFPFVCVSVTDLVMLSHCMEDPRVHTRVAGLEITAGALEDPVSFALLAEVLQHLQERGLLHSLVLLRIMGYSNADLRAVLSSEKQHRIHELQQSAAPQSRLLRHEALAAFAATVDAARPARERRLRRLELLAPKAMGENYSEVSQVVASKQAGVIAGRPVFSKISRVAAYINPFSVLAQALGFQLLSIRVTELLLHCNNCCQRTVAGPRVVDGKEQQLQGYVLDSATFAGMRQFDG